MVEQPEFFVDRSLGRFTVPEALRACGLVVHAMAEVYGERVGQGLQDERWLRDAGERGPSRVADCIRPLGSRDDVSPGLISRRGRRR